MKKRPVCSSNLCLRFYKSAGWNEAFLNKYVLSGKIIKHPRWYEDEEIFRYYIPKFGTILDIDRFLKEAVSVVHRTFNDYPNESDKEFIKRML